MVITMVPHPGDRITRERDRRTRGKEEFQPARHFKAAMRQIAMQIESRADARPEINGEHDRQISPLKARPERDHSENLQTDENDKEEEIEFIVLKHEARWDAARVPQRRNRLSMFLSNRVCGKTSFAAGRPAQ